MHSKEWILRSIWGKKQEVVVSHTYFKCYEQAQCTAFLFPRLLRGMRALQMLILKTPFLRSCPVESLISQLWHPSAMATAFWLSLRLLPLAQALSRQDACRGTTWGRSVRGPASQGVFGICLAMMQVFVAALSSSWWGFLGDHLYRGDANMLS